MNLPHVDIASPWEALRGQVYLGEDKFIARMEKLAAAKDKQGYVTVNCWSEQKITFYYL